MNRQPKEPIMAENQENNPQVRKYAKVMTVVMVIFIAMLCGTVIHNRNKKREEMREKEQARREMRGNMFGQYVIQDTRNWVLQNMDEDKINAAAEAYRTDSAGFNSEMGRLSQDSTKYARAIFRDAGLINALDDVKKKEVSFQDAMDYIDSQESTRTYTKKKSVVYVEHDGQGGFVAWNEFVPGDTVVEYNRSPARILKINKRHLRNISLDLATHRAGKRR